MVFRSEKANVQPTSALTGSAVASVQHSVPAGIEPRPPRQIQLSDDILVLHMQH